MRRALRWSVVGIPVALLAIQLVPYGRSHGNPPVTGEPAWTSPQVRQLTKDACFDCHSNETTWPWYSNVAPVSWLMQHDVDSGRPTMNFSEWSRPQDVDAGDIAEVVRGGSMPPWYYRIGHPKSRLSSAEKAVLAAGLAKTVQASPPGR